MIKKIIIEYFTFTRKERIGVIILAVLVTIVFLLPLTFKPASNKNDELALAEFKDEIAKWQIAGERDSGSDVKTSSTFHSVPASMANINRKAEIVKNENRLFYFDPNQLSQKEWKALGLSDKTITIINHFLEKGGRFKHSEDLLKIYGFRESEFNRLAPYVRIQSEKIRKPSRQDPVVSNKGATLINDGFRKEIKLVEINKADSAELVQISGIGSKLASRILHFRDKLGGFFDLDQLSELYGLPDSSFQLIKSQLALDSSDTLRKIDINLADVNTLQKHPYIRWELAKALVEFRRQHGPFKAREDLLQVALLDRTKLERLGPYLKW